MTFFRSLFLILNLALVGATLLAYIAPYIDPETFWPLSLFGLSYPLLIIFNLFFIGFWLFIKYKYAFISLATLLGGWIFLKGFFAFNTEKLSDKKNELSIVSYNISNALSAYDGAKNRSRNNQEKLSNFLERFDDEDILCLQEVGDFAYDILKKQFPKHHFHWLKKGAIIISRHPIIASGEVDFGTKTNSCLWADINLKLDTIRVYSIHLQSNKISRDADNIVSGPLNDEKAWRGIRGMVSKYKTYHLKRAQQSRAVKEHMLESPHPVIMCGDFNDTPLSYTYHHLAGNMVDAFNERGTGIGTTFRGTIPFLRIDYILMDPYFKPLTFQVIDVDFSDHYPIASLIKFGNPQ